MSRFDPHIFPLSADPHIQYAHNTQSFNRYSYVLNNPIGATDPTGYFTKWLRQMNAKHTWFQYVAGAAAIGAAIGATIVTAGADGGLIAQGIAAGFAGAFTGTYLSGSGFRNSLNAGIKGGVFGGLSAGIANQIGYGGGPLFEAIRKNKAVFRLAHGVTQGALSDAQGQSFRSGFIGAVIGKTDGLNPLSGSQSMAADVAGAALVGGVVAELGGGDFQDGARSAAFVRMFNEFGNRGQSITVTEEFEFTEDHARSTLKKFWDSAGAIAGQSSEELSSWLDEQDFLSQEQMDAAFGLAVDMALTGEIAELASGLYNRNPAKLLKHFASEGISTSELVENIQENWTDTLGSWNPITRHTTVTAGRLNMFRADSPQNYTLFGSN